ncbi:unnamed protein product [Pylaiella littoralis]
MKHLTAFRCQVVKLFAKHLKVEEQKVMLRKGCFPLGDTISLAKAEAATRRWLLFSAGYTRYTATRLVEVGTPGRMRALAAAGSLRLDSSALVVLDLEKNIKGRNVLDMDSVAADTMSFLSDCVRPHLVSSSGSKKKQKVGGGGGGGGGGRKGPAGEGGGQLRIALY